MPDRIKELLKDGKYDYAIIFAGTNDLGMYYMKNIAADITEDIIEIHNVPLSLNIPTIAVTLPLNTFENQTLYSKTRIEINDGLIKFSKTINNVHICNLEIPSDPCDIDYEDLESGDEEFWDDGLHLTPKGYDLLADSVYKVLKPLLV